MHSYPLMTEQCQQAGAHSQATSYLTHDTWRNQPPGNADNSCQYKTVISDFQQPQGTNFSFHNGGYPHAQMSGWQNLAVSHQAVSLQQTTGVVNYSHQVQLTSCQKISANIQRGNTGLPTRLGVHAHHNYGNTNQNIMDTVTPSTTKASSLLYKNRTHCSTFAPVPAYNMQTSQINLKQGNAHHGSSPTVFPSNFNSTTSHCSINNSNGVYSSNRQKLSSSDAYRKAQQYPAQICSVYSSGGNASNSVTQRPNFSQKYNPCSSYPANKKPQETNSKLIVNRSAVPAAPPAPYPYAYSIQQCVKSQSNPNKEWVTKAHPQDYSKQSLHATFEVSPSVMEAAKPRSLQNTYRLTSTGGKKTGGGNASMSNNKISRRKPSSSSSFQEMTLHVSPSKNKRQSPPNVLEALTSTETPSSVKPSDCSAHSAAAGAKVIAVVQPLPCEGFQVGSEQMSPNMRKECNSSDVGKNATRSKEELENCGTETSKPVTTTGGGSKDGSDLLESHSGPQNSPQQSQLDDKKQDAQQSITPPTLANTNSPKDQEDKNITSRPASPKIVVLREDQAYTEQPYISSWLNVNEQLDDIDKEFGFPWSLKYKYYKHESDDESNDMIIAHTSAAGSQMPKQVLPETQLGPTHMAAGRETSTLQDPSSEKSGDESATESCYSFRLDVLPQEVAKEIFEQHHTESLATLNNDESKGTDSTNSSKDDMVDQVHCVAETMVIPSQPLSKPKDWKVHTVMEKNDTANEKKKTHDHIIDLTADDQPSTIILSDDDDLFIVENNTPCLDNPESLTSSEYAIQITDVAGGCEEGQMTSSDINEPCLENSSDTSATAATQEPSSDEDQLENPSSVESLEMFESKECKQSDVDSQHDLDNVSKPDETSVDDNGARLSPSPKQTVHLALYGSAQEDKSFSFVDPEHNILVTLVNTYRKAPALLSVSVSPWKRKHREDVHKEERSAKQQTESFHPTKIREEKKKKLSSAESLKDKPVKRGNLHKGHKRVKKNAKKYAVTVKEPDERRRNKTSSENRDPSTLKENIVLKFKVLPETFKFKDGPEKMEGTPAADSAQGGHSVKKPEPVEGKRHCSSEAVSKSKVTWNMNRTEPLGPPPVPKKSDVFLEFQKKYKKKTQPFTLDKTGAAM